jgi:hypothetical protein
MTHESPRVPWMNDRLRERVLDFQQEMRARFPSVHDKGVVDTQAYGHLRQPTAAASP